MIAKAMAPLVSGNSAVRAMFEEGKALAKKVGAENVYDFSLGNPNLYPPEEVKKAIIDVLETEDPHRVHGYMSNAGFESTREKIAENLNKRFGSSYGMNNIIMVVGAASGLNILLKTVLDIDDEVVVFAPYFVEYSNYVRNYYGKTVVVPPNPENGFMPEREAFASRITDRTKAVIINTPNNPTGVIYPEKTIKMIAEVLEEKEKEIGHPIYLISDEPYRELVYTDAKVPFVPAYYKNALIAYSFSKSLSLPGERIGYVAIPDSADGAEEFIEAATINNRVLGSVNAPSLMQLAVERCLDAQVDVPYYKKNAEDLYKIVTGAGFTAVKPQGAFYLWVTSPVSDEKEFVQAGKEENIIMVPGSSFAGPGCVRLSFCVSNEMIHRSKDAFDRLGKKYFG